MTEYVLKYNFYESSIKQFAKVLLINVINNACLMKI